MENVTIFGLSISKLILIRIYIYIYLNITNGEKENCLEKIVGE